MNYKFYNETKLKNYFEIFLKNNRVDPQSNIDWIEFYNRSFDSARNKKTIELLNIYKIFNHTNHTYISDNVLIVNSLLDDAVSLCKFAFIITDKISFNFVKKHYNLSIDKKNICYIDEIRSGDTLNKIINKVKIRGYHHLTAFGGGRTLDYAKFISLMSDIKLISVPSSLSTHVYASSKIHALKPIQELGFKKTIDGESSHLSLIDITMLDKLFKTNERLVLSGFGDIMAFINSRYDWKEGCKNSNERYSVLVERSIDFIITELNNIDINKSFKDWVDQYIFIQCLLCNITDWVGSAPASGAEHLFAKCIEDEVSELPLHGEIVALGVLIFSYIRNKNIGKVNSLLKKFKISNSLSTLNLNKPIVINALTKSLDEGIRKNRYTILNEINVSFDFFKQTINAMIDDNLLEE